MITLPFIVRHYSDVPVTTVRSESREQVCSGKPRGFWVSCDGHGDGWKDWCDAEMFRPESLTHRHHVVIAANARLLVLQTAAELFDFSAEYHGEMYPGQMFGGGIEWGRVAAQYQGIIIAPYLWSCRLHPATSWYYGWDCASGCIWDAAAIDAIQLEFIEQYVSSHPTRP